MARRDANEFQARVTDDAGILRGKIPSPLVRQLGARAGDYIVFRRESGGRVTVSLARTGRAAVKRAGKKAAKRR